MSSPSSSPYAARPPPASFDEFIAHVNAIADAGGSITVDSDLWEDIVGEHMTGHGARPTFIAALPRPSPAAPREAGATCPVCLQTLAAIETEEEYALASESFFGDPDALGLRELPCPAKHVVCARCAGEWLRLNNTCPLCRAAVDPAAPQPHADGADAIAAQRETERLLALFHAVFGRGGGTGGTGNGAVFGAPAPKEDRSAYAGMYS